MYLPWQFELMDQCSVNRRFNKLLENRHLIQRFDFAPYGPDSVHGPNNKSTTGIIRAGVPLEKSTRTARSHKQEVIGRTVRNSRTNV